MSVIDIPEALIGIIQSYLSNDDYHYFMNTSKTHFRYIKKQTIYYDLEYGKSQEYIHNQHFQELLLSKVNNGWKQIGIRLKESEKIPITLPINKIIIKGSNPSTLDNLKHIEHVIGVKVGKTVPPIPQIKELTIKNSLNLKKIQNLSHLKTLTILHLNGIEDFAPLKHIENITIKDCERIEDFSMFHADTQKSLSLLHCRLLKTVENFRMIRYLTLADCRSLRDVSPLYGIYNLTLLSCSAVEDISGLGNHSRLSLDVCFNIIKGFDSLLNIPYIKLTYSSIEDLTPLRAAKSVILEYCQEIREISPLANVATVIIRNCPFINDLKPLQNIPKLSLMDTEEYNTKTNYANLITEAKLKNKDLTLSVLSIKTIKDYGFLRNIQHLTINGSFADGFPLKILKYLSHLQSISIIHCSFHHVTGLNNIPKVFLEHCNWLTDITALGNNHSVDLRYCDKVKRVDNLSSVPIVTIIGCAGIENYSCLQNVHRLKVLRTGGEVEIYNEEDEEDEEEYDEYDDEL